MIPKPTGKQIPPAPLQFGGVIKEAATDSTPWWPPRVVPPKGAPNVLLIMTDDQGYMVVVAPPVMVRRGHHDLRPCRILARRSFTALEQLEVR